MKGPTYSNVVFDDDLKFIESFNGKNILVTGANGSIGSTLCRMLIGHPKIKINNISMIEGPKSDSMAE